MFIFLHKRQESGRLTPSAFYNKSICFVSYVIIVKLFRCEMHFRQIVGSVLQEHKVRPVVRCNIKAIPSIQEVIFDMHGIH